MTLHTEDAHRIEVVRYTRGRLSALDQTRLPGEEIWLDLDTPEAVIEAIQSLRVRGAPLLGVVGAYGVGVAAWSDDDPQGSVERWAPAIGRARPTATNLWWAVERARGRARSSSPHRPEAVRAAVDDEAEAIHASERASCLAMGTLGAELLPDNARVLTHCNTGALATGGAGTAFAVLHVAYTRGRLGHVWVPESRPLLQGARLTAWELTKLGIPGRLVTDTAVGALIAEGEVDAVVLGADRITAWGDVANKIGTYTLAVLAERHRVPFYVIAPSSTIDARTLSADAIEIEERSPAEVRTFGGISTAPEGIGARNPAFDVTPAELVGAIVTESGVHRPPFRFTETADAERGRAVRRS